MELASKVQSQELAWRILHAAVLNGEPLLVSCANGIRCWRLPPGNAIGCFFDEGVVHPSYGAGLKHLGTNIKARRGFLWPIEEYVYYQERKAIIADILSELHTYSALPRETGHLDNDTSPFIEDFGKALDRVRRADKKPKPETKARLQIKRLNGAWWLFHRQWMPLCFESFEEAVAFARRYISKKAA